MVTYLKHLPFVIAIAMTPPSGVDQGRGAEPEWKTSLLATREAAWRNYYGDADKLAAMLPDDFIAIDNGGGAFANKSQTVASSRADIAAGRTIASLKFPDTRIQRYGDVAIIYTTYELVLAGKDGQKVTASGRATEIFRWNGSRWLHPGWHLDSGR
jgi:ketosteroid isomerase-like protein